MDLEAPLILRIALNMLVGDVAKYAALVVGLAFGTLLFTQQASIFFGLLLRSTGSLQNIGQPELWVGDRDTFFIGNARRLDSSLVNRVRSVPGVRWAEPLFLARARVTKPDGAFDEVEIYGIDRATLIGSSVSSPGHLPIIFANGLLPFSLICRAICKSTVSDLGRFEKKASPVPGSKTRSISMTDFPLGLK